MGTPPMQKARSLRAFLAALAALGALALGAARADAAGMVTHAWMAEEGIGRVTDAGLRGLLGARSADVASGAAYPDSGYIVGGFYEGGAYGEISHWERFINAYVQHIRAKMASGQCGADLADPVGPCAGLVAHMMGAAAHGVGDEMWDWMFEPAFPDHGEDPGSRHRIDDFPGHEQLAGISPELAEDLRDLEFETLHGRIGEVDLGFPGDLIYSSEYAMDVIAIADHGRLLWSPTPPPISDLLQIYSRIGYDEIDAEGLLAGHAAVNGVLAAERASLADAASVRADLPWTSGHMDDESGGVEDVGVAVAGYYEALWRKLHAPAGETPPPVVTSVHPEPEETGVPYIWQPARTQPGPYPDRGGAETRIIAVLSNALDSATVNAANFKLLDAAGTPVPALEGFPRPGPYGNGDGTHTMLFYPASNLEPCSVYTARVTEGLRDWAPGAPGWSQSGAEPFEWSFTTRSAGGEPCPRRGDENPGAPPGGNGGPACMDARRDIARHRARRAELRADARALRRAAARAARKGERAEAARRRDQLAAKRRRLAETGRRIARAQQRIEESCGAVPTP